MPTETQEPAASLYSAKQRPQLIDVPERRFIAVDGSGDPERSLDFELAIDALLAVAHSLKVIRNKEKKPFTVPPLEALWWTDEEQVIDLAKKRTSWHWRVMIAVPDDVTEDQLSTARERAAVSHANPEIQRVTMFSFEEGLCVQALHIGPYSKEQPTIERMHTYANQVNHPVKGKHHEIYIGDPRLASPENLRTILRQPVA